MASQFLFWEYLFQIFGIGSLQCVCINMYRPQSTYRGECISPFSWSVHHNFLRDGRYSERGWACTPQHHQAGLIFPNFSIMMECTPESGNCHSVCTLGTDKRGRILGRYWDRSLKSFPPCYLQSPLLLDFTPLPPPPHSKSGLKVGCDVYGNLKSENSQDYAQNLNEIVCSWIGLRVAEQRVLNNL